MRLRTVSSAIIAAAFSIGLTSCNDFTGPEESLSAARALWSQKAPLNYTMTTQISCECTSELTGPVVTIVRKGVVESRRYARTGELVESRYDDWFPGVEQLFGLIEKAIREDWSPRSAKYDPDAGYPTRVELPGIAQSQVYSVSILTW